MSTLTSLADLNPRPQPLLTQVQFAVELVDALKAVSRASIEAAKLSVKVRDLYVRAIAAGIDVTCPKEFETATREHLARVCRRLLAVGGIELDDAVLADVVLD